MKSQIRKILSITMTICMLLSLIPSFSGIVASAATISSYKLNDKIEFGWYPQTTVTDSSVI